MSLYCTVCSNDVPEGVNKCLACNNGFVSQLACRTCSVPVVRGAATCPRCAARGFQGHVRENFVGRFDGGGALVASQSFRREVSVVRSDAGEFGAISDVTVPDGVVRLMGDIAATVRQVLELANELAHTAPTEGTRLCIRECRNLATTLQEELERRRGK